MATISVVILTKNEKENITECLQSVSWCDERIIIDDFSDDTTKELAKKQNAIVYESKLVDDFARQRNFGLEKATGDWVLFIDADERVSLSLQYEIANVIGNSLSDSNGYYIKRVDTMWGKKLRYGETGSVKLLRIAKRGSGEWKGRVHEEWKVKGKIGVLRNSLLHFPHQSVTEFLKEVNYYTEIRARELHERKVTVSKWQIVLFPLGKFLTNYFGKLGILDGIPGLLFAIIMSFHSFLVRSKLWLLNQHPTSQV